jgi:phospholipid transport system substrate-binding protein
VFRILSVVAIVVALALPARAAPPSPETWVNQQFDLLNGVLAKDPSTHLAGLRATFKDAIDFQSFAEHAMAERWAKLTDKQRVGVRDALQDLIESRYLVGDAKPIDRKKVPTGPSRVKGGEAEVDGSVKQREVDIKFVLKMKAAGDRWRLYDVVIDNLSLVDDYKAQFATFLKKKSVEDLITRLHSRAQNYRKGGGATGTAKATP